MSAPFSEPRSGPSSNIAVSGATAVKKTSRACTECHTAKGRCIFSDESQSRCVRCTKHDKVCVPHLSRQGKRKKKPENENIHAATPAAANPVTDTMIPEGNAAGTSQGHLMDVIRSLQTVGPPATNILAQLQNAANLNAAAGQPLSSLQPTALSTFLAAAAPHLEAARSQVAGRNESILAPPVMTESPSTKVSQDHGNLISHIMNQRALANMGDTRTPSTLDAVASNASRAASLLLYVQNNGLGSATATTPLPNPSTLFHHSNPGSTIRPSHGSYTESLVRQVQQQQSQLREQDWLQQQQNIQQMLRNHLEQKLVKQGFSPQNVTSSHPGQEQLTPGQGAQDKSEQGNLQEVPQIAQQGLNRGSQSKDQQDDGHNRSDSGSFSEELQQASTFQEESRLKKKKKAHLLPKMKNGACGNGSACTSSSGNDASSVANSKGSLSSSGKSKKRNCPNDESLSPGIKSKIPKQDWSSLKRDSSSSSPQNLVSQPEQPSQEKASSPQLQVIDPEENFGNHLLRASQERNVDITTLKYHYGLQALIREWITLAMTRRSFGLLAKASKLALKFGIGMNRILSGVDEPGLEDSFARAEYVGAAEEEAKANDCKKPKTLTCGTDEDTKDCIGGRMHYLFAKLLEPRSVQAHRMDERHVLTPHLPRSLLPHIGCRSFTSFQEIDVRNRWIMIRETYRGDTKFYCSPMFERNVLCWTRMSQIFEDNLADIFSLIFVNGQYDRFLDHLARQVSLHHVEGTRARPVHTWMMKIRLLSQSWRENGHEDDQVTKEMVDENVVNTMRTIEVDMMLSSFQTMDKHVYYLEFFHPQNLPKSSSDPHSNVSCDSSVPPSYQEVRDQF